MLPVQRKPQQTAAHGTDSGMLVPANPRGCSAVGSALRSHRRGREFDSQLHEVKWDIKEDDTLTI